MDARIIFNWAKQHGEVKAIDRILVKVMLILIKNRITLTAASIEKMEQALELPDEVLQAVKVAAETVVGKPLPPDLHS